MTTLRLALAAACVTALGFAAGQVLRKRLWFPISELEGMELARLAELQLLAAGSPNTKLDVQGVLTAL